MPPPPNRRKKEPSKVRQYLAVLARSGEPLPTFYDFNLGASGFFQETEFGSGVIVPCGPAAQKKTLPTEQLIGRAWVSSAKRFRSPIHRIAVGNNALLAPK